MNKIIQCHCLIITSSFGKRTLNGKTRFHRGIDLRSVSWNTGNCLDIIAPENCKVLRQGVDGYGNYFLIVQPLESDYEELKFIHIEKTNFEIGEMILKDQYISISKIGGNSIAHHLHFEVWKDKKSIDPIIYLNERNVNYKYK